jgi:hypothetical protein
MRVHDVSEDRCGIICGFESDVDMLMVEEEELA